MSVKFTDNSEAWNAAIVAGANDGLTAMAAFYADAFRQNIGSEGGGAVGVAIPIRGTNAKKYRFRAFKEGQTNANTGNKNRLVFKAANPGNFPGNRTGALKRSMTSTKASGLVAYAGSPLKYAAWLETGWERRKPLEPKQIRYLHALAAQMKKGGIAVTWGQNGSKGGAVWARPWLRRTIREQKGAAGFVFQTRAADAIAKRVAQ